MNRPRNRPSWAALLTTVLLLGVTQASHAEGLADSVSAGLLHPLAGWGHALSFVVLGVFAWRAGPRGAVLTLAAFVLALGGGFVAARHFVGMPAPEFTQALLLAVLGALLARAAAPALWAAVLLAVAVGYAHGYVHGIELYGRWGAAVGMLVSSTLLAAAGALMCAGAPRLLGARAGAVVRGVGAAAALAGVALLAWRWGTR